MKAMKCMLALTLCMLVSTACSGTKAPISSHEEDTKNSNSESKTEEAPSEAVGGKTLVVFFSHAGDNYSVGNIKVGNTKIVADYISELTGADQFEINTSKYDGMEYAALTELAKKEQQNGELPPFEGEPGDLSQYKTVFIGGPVWWGTYPQVMFTFLKKYTKKLEGKTIIPFTTHEGSGLGSCVKDLKTELPNSTITGEFSIYGHDVRSGKARVEKWLKGLGY